MEQAAGGYDVMEQAAGRYDVMEQAAGRYDENHFLNVVVLNKPQYNMRKGEFGMNLVELS